MTKGFFTSEFVVTAIVQVLSYILVKFGIDKATLADGQGYYVAAVGGLVSIISAVVYTVSRTKLKKASIEYGEAEPEVATVTEVKPVVTQEAPLIAQ